MRILPLIAIVFSLSLIAGRADETMQQRYLDVYLKINDAELLEQKRDYAGALQDFRDCRKTLARIQASNPEWESALVGHGLDDCQAKIHYLEGKVTSPTAATATSQFQPGPTDTAHSQDTLIFTPRSTTVSYPWKTNIGTTLFWIGEDSSHASAWNENWTKTNHGADDPDDRNGFASSKHASSVNPFYVALPFNDLAHPDKASDYVPRSWHRPNVDGKQVSACKDRWVCIKIANGRVCYAQWEDVGPFGNDHAEYVFGNDRPANGHPGIDISPAVAQYLGIDGADNEHLVTSWRFVDDQDVPPGQWLKYDEQALIFTALHQSQKP